jgi:hypothetical protein
MVERNMSNAVMRGIVVAPGSTATSRAQGSRWNLGALVSDHRPCFARVNAIARVRHLDRVLARRIGDLKHFLGQQISALFSRARAQRKRRSHCSA